MGYLPGTLLHLVTVSEPDRWASHNRDRGVSSQVLSLCYLHLTMSASRSESSHPDHQALQYENQQLRVENNALRQEVRHLRQIVSVLKQMVRRYA
jgi:cell division protein FtsB